MTIAGGLAEFCTSMASRPLPAAVEDRARLCLADHLHAAIHGMRSETGERLIRYLSPQGSLGAEALALLLGSRHRPFTRSTTLHQDTSMHPGTVIVSTALACLSEKPASGKLLLAAIAAGYEVGIRLSIAAGERHYHYFHATATCGTLAAAATAAIILGLDREQTAHALGAAATSASGLWEDINDAAIGLKHLHSGFAAERGIRAAKLAQLGLPVLGVASKARRAFSRPWPGPAISRRAKPCRTTPQLREILLAGLGERWTILRNIFKRYPFCLGLLRAAGRHPAHRRHGAAGRKRTSARWPSTSIRRMRR